MFPTSFAQLMLRLSNMNECWADIEQDFEHVHYPQGRVLRPSTDHFYLVLQGTVRTSLATKNGLEWVFLYQKKHCLFNESTVSHSELDVFYTCVSAVELCILPMSLLQDLHFYREHPHLIINFLETLALKEAICYSYMYDLAATTARGRVCQALLALGRENEGQSVFSPELTQAEIASMRALHQTSVARVIKDLRQQGIIGAFTKKKIEILSYEKLAVIAEEIEEYNDSAHLPI